MPDNKTEIQPVTLQKTAYDTTFILSSILLWVLFGVLEDSMSCDFQKIIKNDYFKHIAGLMIIFFLFAVMGNKDNQHILTIWVKSIVIYFIFIITVKSKWYFVLPVIVLLLIDQSIKIQIQYYEKNNSSYDSKNLNIVRKIITYLIYGTIFAGFASYGIEQYHKENFDIIK